MLLARTGALRSECRVSGPGIKPGGGPRVLIPGRVFLVIVYTCIPGCTPGSPRGLRFVSPFICRHGWVWLRTIERQRVQSKLHLSGPIDQCWDYRPLEAGRG